MILYEWLNYIGINNRAWKSTLATICWKSIKDIAFWSESEEHSLKTSLTKEVTSSSVIVRPVILCIYSERSAFEMNPSSVQILISKYQYIEIHGKPCIPSKSWIRNAILSFFSLDPGKLNAATLHKNDRKSSLPVFSSYPKHNAILSKNIYTKKKKFKYKELELNQYLREDYLQYSPNP